MLGGRFFWFLVGVGAGLWSSSWLRRNLKQKSIQHRIGKRVKSITEDLKVAISQDKRSDENNGF